MFLLFVLCMCCPGCLASGESGGGTLLAIYMVGSDLESEEGAGTADLLALVSGFSAPPEECRVVVAYGGAEKEGWRGMRIASITELREDAADGEIGNDAYFLEEYPGANMGDPDTLAGFLAYVDGFEGYGQRYVILWDHGDGYRGFGCDEVSGDDLPLDELGAAFAAGESRYDIIGFDACLMSMIEVAGVLEPHAGLLLASEETEPGSGWEYEPIGRELSENPCMPPEAFGRFVVDSFMENPDDKKTLALIDLGRTGEALAALDGLGTTLRGEVENGAFEPVGRSLWHAQAFDSIPSEGVQTSLDLTDLALRLQQAVPAAAAESGRLIAALDRFVLYARDDGLFTRTGGVAIASPRYITSDTLVEYRGNATVSPAWDAFFDAYVETKSRDAEAPVLAPTGDGRTFTVSDNLAVAEVTVAYCVETEDASLPIGAVPVAPDTAGRFAVPGWDGEWYSLDAGDGTGLLLHLVYEGEIGDGCAVYSAPVEVIRGDELSRAELNAYIDPATHESELVLEFYDLDDAGKPAPWAEGWDDDSLLPGDHLTAYSVVDDESTECPERVALGSITVTETTRLSYGLLPVGSYSYGLIAEDFNGNVAWSDPVAVEVV
ncbi:hypothetical protein ABH15_02590 [Methanoculleus taiwanensis]|uniref:Peptidase C11 n=1 Tax=Methanoculleus taiwanensis TaxID=1550565 RepID=A0A498H4S4_9EURY|nr:hypothetical protein ABH15_02590 [Methanoculleus taiwanensis]